MTFPRTSCIFSQRSTRLDIQSLGSTVQHLFRNSLAPSTRRTYESSKKTICGFLPSYESSPLSYYTGHVMLICRPSIPGWVSPHLHQILLIGCEKHADFQGIARPICFPSSSAGTGDKGCQSLTVEVSRAVTSLGENCLLPHQFFASSKAYGNPTPQNTNSSCYGQCLAPVSLAFSVQGKSPHQHLPTIPVSTSAFKIMRWIVAITHHLSNSI